jgi:hypothetical protein
MTTAPTEAEAVNAKTGQAFKRCSTVADDAEWEREPRTGDVVRGLLKRTASGGCIDCAATFDNIGAATAHARGARHRVQATYSASYIYLPAETIPGGAL